MNRMKLVALAAVAAACLGLTSQPAQAADVCSRGAGQYFCEYGVTKKTLPDGSKQEFVIGTDNAVWTRWTLSGKWTTWSSMGGFATSGVTITKVGVNPWEFDVCVLGGGDRQWWATHRYGNGTWSSWSRMLDTPSGPSWPTTST
ncbi:hypothetical protein [Streptomyces sp. G-G2]|uniref:hypothetical protein n=1 Tax=Streptomyces sp. G-G2 TaxID=3046201 RepID=UPI0024B949A0|nr:hypothetical protein [Streptomyces sp. G-G2]MDJ0383501.1 hypothetical protein [Streptomyces sp. G-G2]